MEPTPRQLRFISEIEEALGLRFYGETKEEASEWIDDHFEEYKLETDDAWAIEHGYI